MIGYVAGKVLSVDSEGVLIECKGVGYQVHVPRLMLAKIKLGERVEVFTHTHVREDVLALYGFDKVESLRVFERLISVPGIGPKTALTIFGSNTAEAIKEAIVGAEVEFFTRIPGIGKKGAQKIIIDLKSKFGGDEEFDFKEQEENKEVVTALMGLGFARKEAQIAVRKVDKSKAIEVQIKEALRYV